MAKSSKYAIQRYWFNELTLEDVLREYGIRRGNQHREAVSKVLMKSKKDFQFGWSFFTREDIDDKILKILDGKANVRMKR